MPINLGMNAALAPGSQQLSNRNDPYVSYNFLVEIEGLLTGGFMEVTGLDSEIRLEEYQEGGMNNYVHKFPTTTVYPNLVLTRGLTAIDTLWNWYWSATQGVIVQLNGTIMLLDRKRLPITWWNFKDAYPVKWVGPQFNASSDSQVAVERIELVHRGISKPLAAQAAALARTVV